MRPPIAAGIALVLTLGVGAAHADRPYRGGAIATQHAYASQAALEMLNQGGNAVDAMVAAAFTLAVVGPYHSGLGGGGFALTYDAAKAQAQVLDFREVAPKGASREMYLKDGKVVPGLSTDGALAVAVPGAVAGYLALLEKSGRLPRAKVMAPAIRCAREGFWVSPKYQQMAQARLEVLRKDPEAARIFLRDDQVPPIGTVIRQPELARTLTRIASEGARGFYAGAVAQQIASAIHAGGGVLTTDDLAAFKVRWRTPLEGEYRGHRILTMPPPSAGGIAILQTLGILELGYPSGVPYREPDALHRLVESMRRVYIDRATYLGDPAFVDIPLGTLISKAHITELARSIDPHHATPSASLYSPDAGTGSAEPHHPYTTHISVVDKDGNAAVMTTTINGPFGSALVAPGTGVLLNNEMDDFAAKPLEPNLYGLVTGEANTIAPGKIPLSSMAPTLVFQKEDPKKVLLAVGSPGGSTIPTTILQVISNVIDAQMDVVRAVGAGRIHHQYLPDQVMVDRYGLEPATERALAGFGHFIRRVDAWGDAEAVLVDPATGLRYAGSDPRNEGAPVGQD